MKSKLNVITYDDKLEKTYDNSNIGNFTNENYTNEDFINENFINQNCEYEKLVIKTNKLELTDLNEDLKTLNEIIGLELLEKLIHSYGGTNFYIPKISSIDKYVERHIRLNRDKTSKKLARELKVSENFIKKRMSLNAKKSVTLNKNRV